MEKETYSTKDILSLTRKSQAFFSKNHEFTKKNSHILHRPIFTIKTSKPFVENLTYRKINDWDSKKLISGSRKNKDGGWRKFSIVDIINLKIISDLRKFGVTIDKIKIIVEKISNDSIQSYDTEQKQPKKLNFLQLEYYIFDCLNGNKNLLLLDDREEVFFFTEDDAVSMHFDFDKASSPILILPFYSYIEKIATTLKRGIRIRKDSTITDLFELRLTEKEKNILEAIRNKDYEQITITKPNGNEIILRAKSCQRGDFTDKDVISAINSKDYQCVTVSKVNGKKITIVREETMKI